MGDDWDDVVTTAPARGSSGVSWNDNNNTGVKPPAGRGRGTATIINQMRNVKVSEDDWGEQTGKAASTTNKWDAPAKTTESSNGWGAPKSSAASSDVWDAGPKTSQFNDADDQPRGGGWGSSGGGGGGGFKGAGGGSRACHKVCINIVHIFFITNCSNLVSTGRTHGKRLS